MEEAAVEEVEEVTEAPQLEEAGVEEIEEVVEAPQMAEAAVEEVEDVVEAPQMEEPTSIDEAEPTYVKSVTDEVPVYDTAEIRAESSQEFEQTEGEIVYDAGGTIEPAAMEFSTLDEAHKPFEPEVAVAGGGIHHVVEPTVEVITPPIPQSRLSDRPVDLPIEVPDDERRIHNDARRFARLLVSEIKLYNEKKVLEGRAASDLYDRLREAIDRSREMYDKRVQPPVAAKFDYFHYELLNALAEGETERLGSSYPGATV